MFDNIQNEEYNTQFESILRRSKMGLVCSCVNISSSILTIWSNIAYTSAPPASVGCCGVRGRVSTGTT